MPRMKKLNYMRTNLIFNLSSNAKNELEITHLL
jgi:hypothetical protein